MGTQSVLRTKGKGGEISFFCHHHWQEAHIEERGALRAQSELGGGGCTRRREVDLEERSGLRVEVDSEERRTLGGHGSDAHLTRVHLKDTGSAHAGYDGEKHTRRIQRSSRLDRHLGYCWCEHRLVRPGRYSGCGGEL